nr:hypothetical protein [Tanacetum cinerariifolium]
MNTGVLLLYLIERRDEMKKIRLDHLKQDQEMLVRKRIFLESERSVRKFVQRGLIFYKGWCSSYRQEIPTVTAVVPVVSDKYKEAAKPIRGPPGRLCSLFVFCEEGCIVGLSFDLLRDCMMVVKEIVNRLLEEVERSWNGGLSKALMMNKDR